MSNNYIDFLEDCLREQTKMTCLILEQLKAAKEELRHYKTVAMMHKFGKEAEVLKDDHRSDSEES